MIPIELLLMFVLVLVAVIRLGIYLGRHLK